MLYRIEEMLVPVEEEDFLKGEAIYAAAMSIDQWKEIAGSYGAGIDLEIELTHPRVTKAEVNANALTGTLHVPSLNHQKSIGITFVMDERSLILIDDNGMSEKILEEIRKSKKWKHPGMERLLYDILEDLIGNDLSYLIGIEKDLNQIEDSIAKGEYDAKDPRISNIRRELRRLRIHYEQLIDLGQELEENENDFFEAENLRFFSMFTNRVTRLLDIVNTLKDYTVQIHDSYLSKLSVRQNNIMTLLTVVTTIFMPLTLIVGWYGMNFVYMPEFQWRHAYPVLILVCAGIVGGLIWYFRKIKWL